jgi:hypothetical protein
MRAYIQQLQRQADLVNTTTGVKHSTASFTPLREQIKLLFASIPARQFQRSWSLRELQALLKGRYRDKPNLAQLADLLRQAGWHRFRDYTNAGRGARLWLPPGVTK